MKGTAHQHQKAVRSLGAQAITVATVNGDDVDRSGFKEALVEVDVGLLGGTSPTLDVKVQEAPDDGSGAPGTYVDVSGAVYPQFTTANSNKRVVGRLNLINRQKFLRLVAVGAGTSPTGSFQGGFILSQPDRLPVIQVESVAFNVGGDAG